MGATIEKIRSESIANQPYRINAKLGDLHLLGRDQLEFSGRVHKLNNAALDGLCKLVGVAKSTVILLQDLISTAAKDQFVETIRAALAASAAGNVEVTLLFQPETKEIIAIQRSTRPSLSNDTFCSIAEGMLSDHGLEISSYSVQHNGDVVINALQPLSQSWEVAGLKDEAFTGGVSISNSITHGTQLNSFLNRLVCLNGMVSTEFDECIRLENINEKGMAAFIDGIGKLASRDFKPHGFDDKVRLANDTSASFHELESAAKALIASAKLNADQIEQWIPYHSTINAFLNYGVNVPSLSAAQKKQAKTGQSVWQVINGMTHFATHDNEIKLSGSQRTALQKKAGDLFSSEFHLSHNVPGPF